MKKVVTVLIISVILITIAFISLSISDEPTPDLDIGTLGISESSRVVGAGRNCIAFASYGYLETKATKPGFRCYYDSATGKIIKQLNGNANAKCSYICSDVTTSPIPSVPQEIQFEKLSKIGLTTKKENIGAGRNCIGYVVDFCRSWNWIEFSCSYNSVSGDLTSYVGGSKNSAYCGGKPTVTCGYICVDDE